MQTLKNTTLLIAAVLFSTMAFAQDGTEAGHEVSVDWSDLMIMDIENTGGSNAITLTVDYGSHEAGAAVTNGDIVASDETTWINWTVFTPSDDGAKYNIDVKSSTNFDDGWTLKATPEIGAVEEGNAAIDQARDLSTADQRVVKDITSHSWSGDGASQGCNIKYEIIVDNVSNITASDQTVTVTYTISKN